MDKITQVLRDIDLSIPEIRIYLALLEIGQAPASVIARKSGLKRGHTYNMLDQLIKKGIAGQMIKADIKHFSVCDPENLVNIIERQSQELNQKKQRIIEMLPFLQSIKNPYAHRPRVHFFEGEQGIKEMYEDTLKGDHKELYAFADFHFIVPENKPRPLNEWIWEYANRRAKKNISYLGIVKYSPETQLAYKRRSKHKRQLRFIKNNISIPAEINIYGDKVAIFSEYKELIGVIIESQTIAQTLKNIHKTLWEYLPKRPYSPAFNG